MELDKIISEWLRQLVEQRTIKRTPPPASQVTSWGHSDLDLWPIKSNQFNLEPKECLWQILRNSLKAFLKYCVHKKGMDGWTCGQPEIIRLQHWGNKTEIKLSLISERFLWTCLHQKKRSKYYGTKALKLENEKNLGMWRFTLLISVWRRWLWATSTTLVAGLAKKNECVE